MKICQDHWHELRNAIRQRGLWGLVAPNGYLVTPTTSQELEANSEKSTLDPLRAISLMISEQAVMVLGSSLLTRNDCPLCEIEYNLGQDLSLEWIETNADTVLALCREQNLVGNEQ